MSPLARRLSAIAALILSLVIIGVLTLRAFGVPLAIGPLGSATALPSPTPAAPSPSADPAAELAAIEGAVADIRDLPAANTGEPAFISRSELGSGVGGWRWRGRGGAGQRRGAAQRANRQRHAKGA